MKKIICAAVLISFGGASTSNAQQKPYFQQRVDHQIKVRLDDKSHYLHGEMTMRYTNNAPDTLREIYMLVYPNAFSTDRSAFAIQSVENGNTAFYLADKEDWGFIDSLFFEQSGLPVAFTPTQQPDIIRLNLAEPIPPGGSTELHTPFRVKIPKAFSRLGHEGQSYHIAQWYPKPAVYDAQGWHLIPYLDQGEFYYEFGSYDVSITLPENYVLLATGDLQTETEQQWLRQRAAKQDVDSLDKAQPSSSGLKTVRYTAEQVHDFAWFADKNWLLKWDTVIVPETGHQVEVWLAFPPESKAKADKAVKATRDAITFYSEQVGPYPYASVKVVEGPLSAGGGMEYPTITVIGKGYLTEDVVIHEVGHNWFQAMLGSNERSYPWMDESINSYYEQLLSAKSQDSVKQRMAALGMASVYKYTMATRNAYAIGASADYYPSTAYGLDIYGKGPAYIAWLAAYMGQEQFDNAMKEYFQTWKFRHPQPVDFESIFRKHSAKNLDWFFADGLNSELPVDFSIKKVGGKDAPNSVILKNKTGFAGPVAIVTDSSAYMHWVEPFQGSKKVQLPHGFREARIADVIPDFAAANNTTKRSLALRPLFSTRFSNEYKHFIIPAMGYNVYDRFMLGLGLHNMQFPEQPFRYGIAAMYGWGSNTVVGTGFVTRSFYPKGASAFQEILLSLYAKRFSYRTTYLDDYDNPKAQFLSIVPELRLYFKKPFPRSTTSQWLTLKAYYIQEGKFAYHPDPNDDTRYLPEKDGYGTNTYLTVDYDFANERTFNPYSAHAGLQLGQRLVKLSAEAKLKIDYFYKDKAIFLRAFGGRLWHLNTEPMQNARYYFASTYSGWNDYLYEYPFIGRNHSSTLASQQIYMKEGGMKVPTLMYANQVGLGARWMLAANVKVDLPIGLPIQLFADVVRISDAEQVNSEGSKWLYDAGISLRLFRFMDVYLPLLMSPEHQMYKESVLGKNAFFKSITFQLHFDKLYWPRIQRLF